MKFLKTNLIAAFAVIGLFAGDTALFAQAGGGRGFGRGGVLTVEQYTQLRDAMQGLAEMTALSNKLAVAQKEAIDAALVPGATETSVRPKVAAVAAIQTDIAVLRFNKAVKVIAPSVTTDQKAQMDDAPGAVYNQLFAGGAGIAGGRGGVPPVDAPPQT